VKGCAIVGRGGNVKEGGREESKRERVDEK